VIIEIDGDPESVPGRDRRRALTLAFALCLAIGSAGAGRDGPAATATAPAARASMMMFGGDGEFVFVAPATPVWDPLHLSLPSNTSGVLLSWIPDRLANEALPPLPFVPVRVRAASGLAVEGLRDGDFRMVTWSERGNVYWLVSDQGDVADLVRLADSLR
jgi:hypothetical protein